MKLSKLKAATPKCQEGMATRGSPRGSPTFSGSPSQSAIAKLFAAKAGAGVAASSPKGTTPVAGGGIESGAAVAKSCLGGLVAGAGTPSAATPGSQTRKGKKRSSLATEAITRAAERAMAAVGRAAVVWTPCLLERLERRQGVI